MVGEIGIASDAEGESDGDHGGEVCVEGESQGVEMW